MSRYIDAEKFYEEAVRREKRAYQHLMELDIENDKNEWIKWNIRLNERTSFKHYIIDFEKADVEEVKHREWICESHKVENMPNWNKWYCSECKVVVKKGWSTETDGMKPTMLYCGECGAKMDGGKE